MLYQNLTYLRPFMEALGLNHINDQVIYDRFRDIGDLIAQIAMRIERVLGIEPRSLPLW
jgi:ribosomal protein L30/L7E